MADAILSRWFSPGFAEREPEGCRVWRERLSCTPAKGYVATCAALRDADLRGELAQIQIPALVVSGEHDIATPPALGRELAGGLPRARFVMLRNAAHLLPIEQPVALAAAIRAFVDESS